MRHKIGAIVASLGVALSGTHCTLFRKSPAKGTDTRSIHQLIPHTIRVRRPAGPGADPKAGPGGTDYTSQPRPDEKFDCRPAGSLFEGLRLGEIRSCLASLKEPASFSYRLERGAVPSLRLDDADRAPECLRSSLPAIPVPREVFFQSNEGGRLLCYSSRLDIEANEVVGLRLPTHRLAVKTVFPLESVPESDEDLRMLLFSWAIAPFWEGKERELPSHIVPDAICGKCIGEKEMVRPDSPPPALWP